MLLRMIKRIEKTDYPLSAHSFEYRCLVAQNNESSLSSHTVFKPFSWVFFPFTWIFNWIISKVGITTEELETSEELVERALSGAALFFYDCSEGEIELREVSKACDQLYQQLSKKWFPNVEGIRFLRQNLIKIKIRAYAVIGQEEEVNAHV